MDVEKVLIMILERLEELEEKFKDFQTEVESQLDELFNSRED